MSIHKSVRIYEVGPREGVQIEDATLSTDEKIMLINSLSQTGLKSIEVASFVSPKWVPKMADAEELFSRITRVPDVSYRSVYLNIKGLERAIANNAFIDGLLGMTASDTFSKRNTNKTPIETIQTFPDWINTYKNANIPVEQIMVMTAFGCNFEGAISLSHVMSLLDDSIIIAKEYGEDIKQIRLTDTMGWANPEQIKQMIYSVRNKWPEMEILLHLHDTRGLGLANAYAAIQEGVIGFDSAIGGLGGCPFGAVKGAAGNIATEDLVFMCEEMGIETGINLDSLLECAKMAENLFGRELPGHLLKGGLISKIRV